MSKQKRKLLNKNSIELDQAANKLMGHVLDPVVENTPATPKTDAAVKKTSTSKTSTSRKKTTAASQSAIDKNDAFAYAAKQVVLAFPRGSSKFENRTLRLSEEIRDILSEKHLGSSESQVAEQLIRLGLIKLQEILDQKGAFVTADLIPIPDKFTNH